MRWGILIVLGFALITPVDSAEPETIFLLHGLGRTSRSMKKMEAYFLKQGYRVHNLSYPSRENKIETLVSDWFTKEIKQKASLTSKNHFIGHSLGSILVRAFLQEQTIPNFGRLVMLSPPNQGSHLTDKLRDWFFYKAFTGPAGQQLGTGAGSVTKSLKPIEAEIGIITGNRSQNLFFSLLIPGPDDGKVSVEYAKLPEMKDFLILPLNHTNIMLNPETFRQSLHFIQQGRFKK